jgi:uncharacterized protein (DUF2147 family)
MKKFGFALALAISGSAAHAGTLFEIPINGGVARFQLDEDCDQGVCASISWSASDHRHHRQGGKNEAAKPSAKSDPEAAAKPAAPAPAPADAGAAPASKDVASARPGTEPSTAPAPVPAPEATPARELSQPQAVARNAPEQSDRPAAKSAAPTPVGEWLVEDGEARIRIEECAENLCGAVSAAKNAGDRDKKNPIPELRSRPIIGLPVLLDMKPVAANRWQGQIYNARNGQTYDANISLADPQKLRVEGCVFGGFICGGQNWTRVN